MLHHYNGPQDGMQTSLWGRPCKIPTQYFNQRIPNVIDNSKVLRKLFDLPPVVLSCLRNETPALQFNFNNSKKYFPSATFLWTVRLSWKVKVLSTHAVVTANATTASPPIAKLLTEPASNY